MDNSWSRKLLFLCALCTFHGSAQARQVTSVVADGERVDFGVAVGRSLKSSSLTFQGRPFHAALTIGSPESTVSGHVEVWWVNPKKYRIEVTSPSFSQTKVVNGSSVEAKDVGDFYPRWLETFVLALVDPIPMADNFHNVNSSVMIGVPRLTGSGRDDRTNGVTDEFTRGQVEFSGPDVNLTYVQTFNYTVTFGNWQPFSGKQIAGTYLVHSDKNQTIKGDLNLLEDLKNPNENLFHAAPDSEKALPIATKFISTQTEEGRQEGIPTLQWPSVREGKTDGYMIVYARTDKTGRVREAAKFSSDNAGVEDYGVEAALKYKFRPIVVDGVAIQMEMPLVLHFTTSIEDPIPILSVEQMKAQTISCNPTPLPAGSAPPEFVLIERMSVDETGKLAGTGPAKWDGRMNGPPKEWRSSLNSLQSCIFKPYVVNGKTTYYKGDLEIPTAKQ